MSFTYDTAGWPDNGDLLNVGGTVNITSLNVINLDAAVEYYFVVIVQDIAGNIAAYPEFDVTTPDLSPPTPGTGIGVTAGTLEEESLTLEWGAAMDNVSAPKDLMYYLYQNDSSFTYDTDGWPDVGMLIGTVTDMAGTTISYNVSNLAVNTKYYFVVIVEDEWENIAAYAEYDVITPDLSPPVPGNSGTKFATDATETTITLNWTAAIDNVTGATDLKYHVYADTSSFGSSMPSGSPVTTLTNQTGTAITYLVNGLTVNTTYYFVVLVEDEQQNKAMYTEVVGTTADITPPVPGDNGSLFTTDVKGTSLILNWTKASDNVSAEADLLYYVYQNDGAFTYGTDGVPTNGTLLNAGGSYDIDSYLAGGLSPGKTDYFTVGGEDEAGNVAAYGEAEATTSIAVIVLMAVIAAFFALLIVIFVIPGRP
jgi:hypothetical protein